MSVRVAYSLNYLVVSPRVASAQNVSLMLDARYAPRHRQKHDVLSTPHEECGNGTNKEPLVR